MSRKDFFEMIDLFLNWDGADIIAPSPHTYWYEYEGKKHFYIPDAYSTSLNLEIEFKDGGDNPNKHPKILAVDKIKEQKKDEVMKSLKNQVNYIKICNKDYSEFFALLSSLKEKDVCQLPKWESKLESIYESTNIEDSSLLESKSDKSISPDVNMSKEFNKLIKRYNKLNNPILNYDDLLGYYRKRIFYDNLKKHEWQYTYNELLNVRNYLKRIVNSNSNGLNERMYYEANKALEEINNFILYMEDRDNFKYVKESLLESATKSKKYPVYIVSWDYKSMVGMGIKMVTRSKYNHTSISLSPDLEKCYTFSRNPETLKSEQTNGFCNETMSYMLNRLGDCNIKVDAVYVSKKKYDKLKSIIDYYIEHQEDTSFSYKNFVKIFFGIKDEDIDEDKLNCSIFTDLVLKKADVNLTGDKPSNLVTPKDLSNVTNKHKNVITVYTGKASLYDKNKVKKIMMESMGESNHTYDEGTIPEVSWFSEYGKDVNLSDHTGIPIDESTFIEGEKDDTKYYPIFIILSFTNTKAARIIKKFTHDPYSHASISFDTTLNNMVSFDANGVVDEDISKGVWKTNGSEVKYSLYMYMATEKEYESMRNFVNNLLSRRHDLKYNFLGLTNFIFGRGSEREDKFFCSEFVTAVINAGNNNLITDKPYMISPYMLAKNKNFKFVKRGIIKNYSPKVVDNIVRDILEEGGYTNVQIR